jgi:hypothetical protein
MGIAKKIVGGLVPVRYRDKAKRLVVRWAVSGGAESFPGLGTSVLDRMDALCLSLDNRIASLEARLAKLEDAVAKLPPAPR